MRRLEYWLLVLVLLSILNSVPFGRFYLYLSKSKIHQTPPIMLEHGIYTQEEIQAIQAP